jgi:transglutaminase-like putative cysteine protease
MTSAWLTAGPLSQLTAAEADTLRARFGGGADLSRLIAIGRWLRSEEFVRASARGATIGLVTASELLATGRLGGCHDSALLYVAAARASGVPARVVHGVGLAWARAFASGRDDGTWVGHFHVEALVAGSYVLADPVAPERIAFDWDPTAPDLPDLGGHGHGASS